MSQTHFQNENILVNVSRNPGCRIRLEIKVAPIAADAAYKKALKNINKEVTVPGFRKGKAPDSHIIKNYGKHIDREWKDITLNTAFQEALKLTNIYPYTQKSVYRAEVKQLSLEEGGLLEVEYESAPEIPTVDVEAVKIHPAEREAVSEKEIDDTIEQARLMKTKWIPVVDRGVEEGDYVDLDIVSLEEPPQTFCENTRFEVAKGKMGDWMRKLIIGLTPGQSAEGMSEKEECKGCNEGHEHHTHEEQFKPTQCKITVRGISKTTLPELNDEFAKAVGCQTVAELREKVIEDLNKRADNEVQEANRRLIEKELLEKYPFEIPFSLVKGQMDERKSEIIEELKEGKLDDKSLKEQTENIGKEVEYRLMRDFKVYFLAQKIAQENKIQISQQDLMNELMHQMVLKSYGQSFINDNMPSEEVHARLYSVVLVNKALDFLIEKSTK